MNSSISAPEKHINLFEASTESVKDDFEDMENSIDTLENDTIEE